MQDFVEPPVAPPRKMINLSGVKGPKKTAAPAEPTKSCTRVINLSHIKKDIIIVQKEEEEQVCM